jgi:hypothetical protein
MASMTPWLMVTITRQIICHLEFCFSKKPHWQGKSKGNNPTSPITFELFICILSWHLYDYQVTWFLYYVKAKGNAMDTLNFGS